MAPVVLALGAKLEVAVVDDEQRLASCGFVPTPGRVERVACLECRPARRDVVFVVLDDLSWLLLGWNDDESDFDVLAAASLLPPGESPDTVERTPSTQVDVCATPVASLPEGHAAEFRVFVSACARSIHCVTVGLLGDPMPVPGQDDTPVWLWTVHRVPSILHQFMGWASRKRVGAGAAGAAALAGAGAAAGASDGDGVDALLDGGDAAVGAASGEMEQHWVPFEGLSTAPERPTEVLGLRVLLGNGSDDFAKRTLVAVLYQVVSANPSMVNARHLRVVAVDAPQCCLPPSGDKPPAIAPGKGRVAARGGCYATSPMERGPWFVSNLHPTSCMLLRAPRNCGGIVVVSDWAARLYGQQGLLGWAEGSWHHAAACTPLRRVHKSTAAGLEITDALVADAAGQLHVVSVGSTSLTAQVVCCAASTMGPDGSASHGAPVSGVVEAVPGADGGSSTMRTLVVSRTDGTVQIAQLRRTNDRGHIRRLRRFEPAGEPWMATIVDEPTDAGCPVRDAVFTRAQGGGRGTMVLGCGEGCSGGLQLCEYGWHVYPVATGAELSERPRLMRLVSAARRATVLLTFPHEQSTQALEVVCSDGGDGWDVAQVDVPGLDGDSVTLAAATDAHGNVIQVTAQGVRVASPSGSVSMWPSATPVTVACAAVHTLERADSGGTSAAVVLGLDDEVLLALVHGETATVFGVATIEPGWTPATVAVWCCKAGADDSVMWCCGAGPWDKGVAACFVADPRAVADVVAGRLEAQEAAARESTQPQASDGWAQLTKLTLADEVTLPADSNGLHPQPLSMAWCGVSGGTRVWLAVGLGDGRVAVVEVSPAFGADGSSLTVGATLVATFHVDEVPLSLTAMTLSRKVASEVLGEDSGATLPAVLATGFRRHVLLVPQSASLHMGGGGSADASEKRGRGGDVRASRAGVRDTMGTWHVTAIVVHSAAPLVAMVPLLTSGANSEGDVEHGFMWAEVAHSSPGADEAVTLGTGLLDATWALHRQHETIGQTPLAMANHAKSRSLVVATQEGGRGVHHLRLFDWQLQARWDLALQDGHVVTGVSCGDLVVTRSGGSSAAATSSRKGLRDEYVMISSYLVPPPEPPQRVLGGDRASGDEGKAGVDDGGDLSEWEVAPSLVDEASRVVGMATVMRVHRAGLDSGGVGAYSLQVVAAAPVEGGCTGVKSLLGQWLVVAAASSVQVMRLRDAGGDTPATLEVASVGLLPDQTGAVCLDCTGRSVFVGLFPADIHVFAFDPDTERLLPSLVVPTNWPANVCLGVSETSFVCADASPVVQLHSFEWVEPAAAKARQAHATPARADTLQSTWQLSEIPTRLVQGRMTFGEADSGATKRRVLGGIAFMACTGGGAVVRVQELQRSIAEVVAPLQAFLAQECAREPTTLLSRLSHQWAFRAASAMLGVPTPDGETAAAASAGAGHGAGAGAGADVGVGVVPRAYPVVSGDLLGLFLSPAHTSAATRNRAARAVEVPLQELTKLLSRL